MPARRTTTLILLTAAAALGCAGCSADDPAAPTLAAPAPQADTAPPAVPTGTACAAAGTAVKIWWDPNTTDTDLDGFLVYEMNRGRRHLLTDKPVPTSYWIDRQPAADARLYLVTAVDLSGNESAWATLQWLGPQAVGERPAEAPAR